MQIKFLFVIPSIADILDSNRPAPQCIIVRNDRCAFARAHVLIDLEAEDRYVAEGAYTLTADHPASALSAVLHQIDPASSSHPGKIRHVARRAIHVSNQDGRSSRRDPAFNVFWIQAKRVVNIGKDRHGAKVDHCCRDRDPQVSGNNYLLARTCPKRAQSSMKCRVPLVTATAWRTPTKSANSRSNCAASRCGSIP